MSHVFLSYHHNGGDLAELIKERLESNGFAVWLYEEKLLPGDDWRAEIDNGIREAFALIVIMSPSAKTSEYVTYEWAFALGCGVKVIPLLEEAVKLHPRLEALQYLDFTDRKRRSWVDLISVIQKEAASYESRHVVKNNEEFERRKVIQVAFRQLKYPLRNQFHNLITIVRLFDKEIPINNFSDMPFEQYYEHLRKLDFSSKAPGRRANDNRSVSWAEYLNYGSTELRDAISVILERYSSYLKYDEIDLLDSVINSDYMRNILKFFPLALSYKGGMSDYHLFDVNGSEEMINRHIKLLIQLANLYNDYCPTDEQIKV